MTAQPIPRQEQLDAIVTGRTRQLADKYFMGSEILLARGWTVSKREVVAYARSREPGSWVQTTPGAADGVYILQRGTSWVAYFQERGIAHGEQSFSSFEDAYLSMAAGFKLPEGIAH